MLGKPGITRHNFVKRTYLTQCKMYKKFVEMTKLVLNSNQVYYGKKTLIQATQPWKSICQVELFQRSCQRKKLL